MNYEADKIINDEINAKCTASSLIINSFPKGPMGLTPDHIRATPEWQRANEIAKRDFAALRNHNAYMVKNYKKEMAADRAARRAKIQNSSK